MYPILIKAFEENEGYIQGEKLEELVKAAEGELTRKQIRIWFYDRRQKIKAGTLVLYNDELQRKLLTEIQSWARSTTSEPANGKQH